MGIFLAAVLILGWAAPAAIGEEAVSREEFDQLKAELAELKSRVVTSGEDQAGGREAAGESAIFGEYWDDGLHTVSKDGNFDIRIGGRIDIEGAFFGADGEMKEAAAEIPGNDPFESGWEVRHPRLYLKGRIYKDFLYKLQYTFSDGTLGDAFIGAAGVPILGTVIVGKSARAFGNDPGPSSDYTLFMESANTVIFGAGKQVGLASGAPILDRRVSWAAQVFQFVDGKGLRTEDNYNLNLRLTGLPWYRDGGREMFHLGTSYSFRSSEDDYRLQAQPENHLAPYLVDTGEIDMKYADLVVLEGAWVEGPFSLEG